MKMAPELSIVISCLNEAEVLPLLKSRLLATLKSLGVTWEAIFVDDGSSDDTLPILAASHAEEPRIKVVALSRNFGQQAAIAAGLAHATGDVVAIMDADLQDPPELIGAWLARLAEGYDVVYGIRRSRKESLAKRLAYSLFYRLLRKFAGIDIPLDSGDFCLMTRRVANVLRMMPERTVFWRGLRAWTGFRQIGIEYERDARFAGKTKYSLARLCRLAGDGLSSFSVLPFRVAAFGGVLALVVSFLLVVLLGTRDSGQGLAGFSGLAIAFSIIFFGTMQVIMLACIGEYAGRIHTEIKQRPRWIVRESAGFDRDAFRIDAVPNDGCIAGTCACCRYGDDFPRTFGLPNPSSTAFESRCASV